MTSTKQPSPPSSGSMHIDPYERNWMMVGVGVLVLFMTGVTIAGFALGYQLPGEEGRVDPRTVLEEGPWADPGVRQISENHFEAYVIARQFLFDPNVIELPAGASVDIFVTSSDVQHGFKVTDTNINMQIVPGQISKLSFTFDEPGEYPIICHEYCGLGHATMFGTVRVVSPTEFEGEGS